MVAQEKVGRLTPLLLLDRNAIDACCLLKKASLMEMQNILIGIPE